MNEYMESISWSLFGFSVVIFVVSILREPKYFTTAADVRKAMRNAAAKTCNESIITNQEAFAELVIAELE